MDLINIDKIKNIKRTKSSITFNDTLHDYSFSLSKSTLNKRFLTEDTLSEFPVAILKNPLQDLKKCLKDSDLAFSSKSNITQTIYLPLYGKNFTVFDKSGLNQWNAKGRKRDFSEVYIPIPIAIHKRYPNFFPARDEQFNLKLPSGNMMLSKVCQDGNKALMSYSNKELGRWILRDVLKLNEGELLSYQRLDFLQNSFSTNLKSTVKIN